jgi:hypothetical protein
MRCPASIFATFLAVTSNASALTGRDSTCIAETNCMVQVTSPALRTFEAIWTVSFSVGCWHRNHSDYIAHPKTASTPITDGS